MPSDEVARVFVREQKQWPQDEAASPMDEAVRGSSKTFDNDDDAELEAAMLEAHQLLKRCAQERMDEAAATEDDEVLSMDLEMGLDFAMQRVAKAAGEELGFAEQPFDAEDADDRETRLAFASVAFTALDAVPVLRPATPAPALRFTSPAPVLHASTLHSSTPAPMLHSTTPASAWNPKEDAEEEFESEGSEVIEPLPFDSKGVSATTIPLAQKRRLSRRDENSLLLFAATAAGLLAAGVGPILKARLASR